MARERDPDVETGSLVPKRVPLWSMLTALASAGLVFLFLWSEETSKSVNERLQVIELTDSFVAIFSEARGDDAIIPAEFRRLGIEHFSATSTDGSYKRSESDFRMPGRPGLEIRRAEANPRLGALISDLAESHDPNPIHEHRFESGRVIARTLMPSIAKSESCITCHNAILNQEVYQIGDVMGAYIVERDLTQSALIDAKLATIWLFASFLLLRAIGLREESRKLQLSYLNSRVRIEEIKNAAEAKEKFLLSHDPLTDLPNRKMFNDHLNALLGGSTLGKVTAMLIDLDEFKAVNDYMGHAVGDALLVGVGARLKAATRDVQAMVARIGGDEFAIAWKSQRHESEPDEIAQRILDAIGKPLEIESWICIPQCSIGVAMVEGAKDVALLDLLKSADAALYAAKGKGKNTYQIYNESIDAAVRRKDKIASQLPKSIQNKDIHVTFQPQVRMRDGQLHGFEALARWPLNGQNISPSEFIEIAESTGSIRDLDLLVLEKAARQSIRFREETGLLVPISVNLSVKSSQGPGLCEDIQDILFMTGFPAERLTVELTESAVIERLSFVKSIFKELRAVGVRTSLDDFGTGYSSLSYLTEIDFDEVKIDREFVRGLAKDTDRYTLLTHIASMLGAMNKDLVVEGIETQTQAALIRELGPLCIGQGYLFSKPLEPDQAIMYLYGISDTDRLHFTEPETG